MPNPQVSVIIPVYNVRDYLSQCIDSVLNQDLLNIEIIIVNDGSTDGSGEICDNYANVDNRIRTFHQENAGVSVARNFGIRKAEGDWICFVDGDDLLAGESVLKTVTDIKSDVPDIIIARSFNLINNRKTDEKYYFDISFLNNKFNGYDLLRLKGYNRGSVCGCIFNSAFLNSYKLGFPEGLRNAEDSIFFILCLAYAKNIQFSNIDFYYINQRQGSASRSWSIDRISSMSIGIDFLYRHMDSDKKLIQEQKYIMQYGIYMITYSIFYKSYAYAPLKSIITLRIKVKKILRKKINTGGISLNKKRIIVLNISLTAFILMIYTSLFLKRILNR